MQRSPTVPTTPKVHLPPLELGYITHRLRKEHRHAGLVINSAPGSKRRSLTRLSRGSTTPRRHSVSNLFDDDNAPYTPTRVMSSSRRLSEVLGERRRRSSMYLSRTGDTVFQTDYVGPINLNYLRYLCKVTLQEKEKGKEITVSSPPYIAVNPQPQGSPRLSLSKSNPLTSKFSSPLHEDQVDYNESLPLPSDADIILKSPDLGILADHSDHEYEMNLRVLHRKAELLVTPPPKKLSFLERILESQRNSHKGQDVRTPERDPMEIYRMNNDVFMIPEGEHIPEDQSNLDAGVEDTNELERPNGEEENFGMGYGREEEEIKSYAENPSEPLRLSFTPIKTLTTNDTLLNSSEDRQQNEPLHMITPSPPRTEFNDNFSPNILVENEFTVDTDSGSENEISKLLNDKLDEPINSDTESQELLGLRSPILLSPSSDEKEQQPITDHHTTRIVSKLKTQNKVPVINQGIPLSMIRNLVKSISSQCYNRSVDYPATTKRRRGSQINKRLLPLVQDLSLDFLSGLMKDLSAYVDHRKGLTISMKDVTLYTKRLDLANSKLHGNTKGDNYNEDSIMLLAQKFLPLETLNELQASLKSESMPFSKKRKITSQMDREQLSSGVDYDDDDDDDDDGDDDDDDDGDDDDDDDDDDDGEAEEEHDDEDYNDEGA